jgi:hypothetical protein
MLIELITKEAVRDHRRTWQFEKALRERETS